MIDAPESETEAGSKWASRGPSIADAIRESAKSIAELAQSSGDLLSAKLDQLRLSLHTLVLYAALSVIGVIAAAAAVVVSVVLLFVGASDAIGAALGGRDWIGDLIVGAVALAIAGTSVTWMVNKFMTASRRRTVRKYENRRKQQRERFG